MDNERFKDMELTKTEENLLGLFQFFSPQITDRYHVNQLYPEWRVYDTLKKKPLDKSFIDKSTAKKEAFRLNRKHDQMKVDLIKQFIGSLKEEIDSTE
ncbi:MAG: hypothetical protein AMQ22_00021 [Candidatus Methanofastidiosum methylothiophilum]|uniref:Uncharacterized protein n=1 Tax=Candidatus Methanofastidiosum methylothiophilum TaxID=1705564 RepID=A0A150J995_9EURY|nr:MAG: hypothetical protein AMQ22_00021 [Candidatus Methanofastidiosum methylthiophilus]